MTPFSIAAIQMHVGALEENISAMRHRLDLAIARFPWVQMVVFSELAPYGPLSGHATDNLAEVESIFQEMAVQHGVWLVPGSVFERVGDDIYNTASVIDPQGRLVGRYRKMFPFRPYENDVRAGTEFMIFDVPDVGRFGVSICYDIWFPETTRTLTANGVEVLLHPVLTGTTDRDVELSIARASAAMFQCYVVDVNGLAAGGCGRSAIIDPAGLVLHQAAGQEEIIPMEIDLDLVRRQRETGLRGLGQTLKSFRDRDVEFDLYDRANGEAPFLESLGPLKMPDRGSRAGLDVRPGALELDRHGRPVQQARGPAPEGGGFSVVESQMKESSG